MIKSYLEIFFPTIRIFSVLLLYLYPCNLTCLSHPRELFSVQCHKYFRNVTNSSACSRMLAIMDIGLRYGCSTQYHVYSLDACYPKVKMLVIRTFGQRYCTSSPFKTYWPKTHYHMHACSHNMYLKK